ncbi:FxsA family protein [Polycyclovorans algicola]|uniref:FxsA family protein n=1 Tax=Polycyclovorans algicola TaxID=616992 RepID=UPI0004A6C83C|nr:FxsA family protein [Polycyclovorans algicola]
MPLLMLFVFVATEIWLLVELVNRFGAGPIFGWIFLTGLLGVWTIKHTGLNALRKVQIAAAQGELPQASPLADLMKLVGGLMFLLPGVISDVIGATLVLGGSLRERLAGRLQSGIAKARPDLRRPVILEGEYKAQNDD